MKNICKRLTTLLLVFAIVATTVSATITAKAVDLSRSCSLTVSPGSSEFAEEFAEAGIVIDLYRVAELQESSSDSYTYNLLDSYKEIELSDSPDNTEWRQKSQEAAKLALIDCADAPVVSGAPVKSPIGGLDPGLYLVIARGQNVENYIRTVTDDSGNGQIATIANSQSHTYTFAPELVSMPGKEADASGSLNTANSGAWIYDMSITLKPEQDSRYGALEIDKTLLTFNASGQATFVFSIEAVLNGETVYSDVVSITFTDAGQQSCRIGRIPVGAVVTVTEIYSGACYTLASAATQSVVITADELASVSFTNDYDGGMNQGSGITNSFEYSSESGWSWTQISDNS